MFENSNYVCLFENNEYVYTFENISLLECLMIMKILLCVENITIFECLRMLYCLKICLRIIKIVIIRISYHMYTIIVTHENSANVIWHV